MKHVPRSRFAQRSRYALVMLAAVLSGCQASIEAYPERPYDAALPTPAPLDSVRVAREFYQLPTEEQRRNYRNELIAERIAAINISYRLFEEQLFREGAVRNIATDWALLGLAGAGATIRSSGTQQILAAVLGGLVGARAAFDKNALFDRALPALVAKMEASRSSVEERLLNGMKLDANAYGLVEALSDLDTYYIAGTLPGAILNVAGDAGVLKAQIQQRRTFSARSLDGAGRALIPLLTGASGTLDAARVKQLRTCLTVIGLSGDILVVDFLYGGEFIAERPKAVTCMQATPAPIAAPPTPTRVSTGSGTSGGHSAGAATGGARPAHPAPAPGGTGTERSAAAVDVAKLNDQLTELLKDSKTGLPSKPRVDLVRSCYPSMLNKSLQPNQLLDNATGLAKEKQAIVACVQGNDLSDQLEELLKDPKTGVPTKERSDQTVACYPATLSKAKPPLDLLLDRAGLASEKKAIVDCMKKS
jgi:hypothetical protein